MNIVLGPPGTGKTTKLLDLVVQEMKSGVPPDRIAYLAFTKQAAHVAISRAQAEFNLTSTDLPFFRTIHSLAFNLLGLSRQSVLSREHLDDLSERLGLKITGRPAQDGSIWGQSKGDRLLHLVNRARVRCISLREEYDKSRESFGWWELERVERALSAYKEQNGLRDFTDMLVEYLDRGAVPVLEALFVDEAQDLSALQWMLIRHLMKETEARVYIAGDDDQAIFRWAGADVETFVDLAGEVNVLRQSYRVPRAVQRVASGLVQRIGHRRPKDWVARPEAGSVHYAMRPEQVDMSDGTWLVLARNKMQLRGLSDWCRRHGWHYSWFHEPSVSQKMLDAVTSWEAFRKERKDDDWKRACEYITNGQQKALSASRNLGPWFESLDRISHADREYIRAILRRGGRIGGVPRIALSTIHSAKGGEADHVLLLTDILRRSHDEMRRFPDDEVRVFYVGATRARESLHIVKPRTKFYFKI